VLPAYERHRSPEEEAGVRVLTDHLHLRRLGAVAERGAGYLRHDGEQP